MSNFDMLKQTMDGAGLEALDLFEIRLPHKPERIVTRCGLRVSLYFQDGATIEKREAGLRVMHSYWNAFHEHLTHWLPSTGGAVKKIKKGEFPPIDQPEAMKNLREWYGSRLYGYLEGQTTKEPALFMADISCIWEIEKNENSSFEAHIPMSWAIEHGYDTVRELVRQWASELNAVHGTCGISLLFEDGDGKNYLKYSYFLLKKFPGLDYENSARFSVESNWRQPEQTRSFKIRTNNWLTILGDEIVKELGGKAHIENELGPDCPIFDYKGGIIIQATPAPELGDAEYGVIPEGYRKVARLTKPVRFEAYSGSLFENLPTPLDDHDETIKWINRFD